MPFQQYETADAQDTELALPHNLGPDNALSGCEHTET
jgi:hypothetical protein